MAPAAILSARRRSCAALKHRLGTGIVGKFDGRHGLIMQRLDLGIIAAEGMGIDEELLMLLSLALQGLGKFFRRNIGLTDDPEKALDRPLGQTQNAAEQAELLSIIGGQ